MPSWAYDLLAVCGLVLLTVGLGLIYFPLALLAAGLMLLLLGFAAARLAGVQEAARELRRQGRKDEDG